MGKKMNWANKPHPSHKMGEVECAILAPAGTPRFYAVRACRKCGASQAEHAAGQFIDNELKIKCPGKGIYEWYRNK